MADNLDDKNDSDDEDVDTSRCPSCWRSLVDEVDDDDEEELLILRVSARTRIGVLLLVVIISWFAICGLIMAKDVIRWATDL